MPIEELKELIRQLENAPEAVLDLPEVRTPEVFGAWIRRCLEIVAACPRESLRHVDTALDISTEKCQIVQCLGLSTFAYRNLSDFDAAQTNLDMAFRLGRRCDGCQADLLRRRGILRASLGLKEDSLADADTAIEAHLHLPTWLDHSLTGYGLADSYLARGDIRQFFGIPAGDEHLIRSSIEDFSKVLVLANPVDHSWLYGHGLFNLGYVLRQVGGVDSLLLADEHIREAWKYFKGRKGKASRERAHLDWQTAMVRFELLLYPEGRKRVKERPAHLRTTLCRARNDFIEVGMPIESSAVASDLALVVYPMRSAVIDVMDETLERVRVRWSGMRPEVRMAFEPVRQAMLAVQQAADADVMDGSAEEIHSRMRASIERLRETCGEVAQGHLLPCLLTWPAA